MTRTGLAAGLALLVFLVAVPDASGQAAGSCDGCHAELEFLRQHTQTVEDARALLAPEAELAGSAHAEMGCLECHGGVSRYPHDLTTSTETCASCHEEAEPDLAASAHAIDTEATCASCHGIHDVRSLDQLQDPAEIATFNGGCESCHRDRALAPTDAHGEAVLCSSCHGSHSTVPSLDSRSLLRPELQGETCGICHDTVTVAWLEDAHGVAVHGEPGAMLADEETPGCTGCHGGHGMLAPSHDRFDQDMVDRCAQCHVDYADTYFGTYHGKVTELGSEIAATCNRCHGSHTVFASDDPRSWVHAEALVGTCAECHEQARPAFVLYDSHPDPLDRSRNAPLFYSFVFMNVLLVGVLGLFTVHTVAWWVRLLIEQRKGPAHAGGEADV